MIVCMSGLPRITESTREQIAREFDQLGPDACVAEISAHLRRHNPEWLYMAAKCARDAGDPNRVLAGFCMFYRLMIAQALPGHPLPRVTEQTRAAIIATIDNRGPEVFLIDTVLQLEGLNPELLQMAHSFAADHEDYVHTMQGFALLYTALLMQSGTDRMSFH